MMLALSLTLLSLPFIAGGISLGLVVFRPGPGRGLGWALLALVGSVMMLVLPVAAIGAIEKQFRLSDPGPVLMLVIGLSGVALFGYSARRKILASQGQPAGRCVDCGYDRAGLARGAKCPECGGWGDTG